MSREFTILKNSRGIAGGVPTPVFGNNLYFIQQPVVNIYNNI